jgi:hypothetical protein
MVPTGAPADCANPAMHPSSLIVAISKHFFLIYDHSMFANEPMVRELGDR